MKRISLLTKSTILIISIGNHTTSSNHLMIKTRSSWVGKAFAEIDLVAQLAEHWTNIPKVAGSIPTVVKLKFQPARCEYTFRLT